MPINPELFIPENYEKFLSARRELLAQSANMFLDSLLIDEHNQIEIYDFANRDMDNGQVIISQSDEEDLLLDVSSWMKEKGLFEGITNYELTDESGNLVMIIDLAWPQGIQLELSEPVALLINESSQNQAAVNLCGYKYFTSVEKFQAYVIAKYVA